MDAGVFRRARRQPPQGGEVGEVEAILAAISLIEQVVLRADALLVEGSCSDEQAGSVVTDGDQAHRRRPPAARRYRAFERRCRTR